MKITIKFFSVALIIVLLVGLVFKIQSGFEVLNPRIPTKPIGFQGELVISEQEFLPVIENAKSKIANSYQIINKLDKWRFFLSVLGFIVGGILAFIAGFYGQGIRIKGNEIELSSISNAQISSIRMIRLLGVLVALTTVLNLAQDGIQSEMASKKIGVEKLNTVLLRCNDILYNPKSSMRQARTSLLELETGINQLK